MKTIFIIISFVFVSIGYSQIFDKKNVTNTNTTAYKLEIKENYSFIDFSKQFIEINPDEVVFSLALERINLELLKNIGFSDFTFNYQIKNYTIGIAISNFMDQKWSEIGIASELHEFENNPIVDEIQFIPQTQFMLKGMIVFNF